MPPRRWGCPAAPCTGGCSSMDSREPDKRTRPRLSHEGKISLVAVLSAMPAAAVALLLLWTGDHAVKVQWTLSVLVVGGWLGGALALREQVVRPLQTISNLLGALREDDFSIRARYARPDDALGEALAEVN